MSQCLSVSTRDIIVLAGVYIVAGAIGSFAKGVITAFFRERARARASSPPTEPTE